MADARRQLLSFLDRKVFDPILAMSEGSFSAASDKRKFRDLKDTTERVRQRYHGYESAVLLREHFERDLDSDTSRRLGREAEDLDLPKLDDVRQEFLRLCERLGV